MSIFDNENIFLKSLNLLYNTQLNVTNGVSHSSIYKASLVYSSVGMNTKSSQFSLVAMSGNPRNSLRNFNIVLTFLIELTHILDWN